ncbi:hypothetical protein [Acrocarpospora sp. B8E8]|uniref:hypothetical protein n=1 Tax=Acrocarpospora sp. B8E8 TaxID=3153572 RepID=UPI00325D88E8
MLISYAEIRDRIYELARQHDLRVDWAETTRSARLVLLHDRDQIVVGRASVPVRPVTARAVLELQRALEHLFGKEWLK